MVAITIEDVQYEAEERIGRKLTEEKIDKFQKRLDLE
jgi:hypothetical protein